MVWYMCRQEKQLMMEEAVITKAPSRRQRSISLLEEEIRKFKLLLKEVMFEPQTWLNQAEEMELSLTTEEIRRREEDEIRSQGKSFYTVDGDCKSSGRSKHRTGDFVIAIGMAALLIQCQLEKFGCSSKSLMAVDQFPPSVLVEGGIPFEAFFINMHVGDPSTGKVSIVLPKAGLRIAENSPNDIITKPDTTILGENQLSHTKVHGEDTSLQKPREEKGKKEETLPTDGGTPRSSSHSKNSVGFKFSRHFSLALLILSLLWSFAVAASIGDNSEQCPPQQFIELGRTGVVRCADQGNVSRVYWSNDANEVLIQFENGELAGPGYWNGELNLKPNGSLVINSVNIQHESTYRVRFLDSDLKISSYQVTVTVYVPPRPPCIVVEGCKSFHTCNLTVRRGEAITCKVNGVRPQVDLIMVADSPVGIITIPDTEIGEDGLFYTTIRGYTDVNETTWGKNVTVTCKALGLATIGLTSDVHITVNNIRENCSPAATTISPEQDHSLTVSISVAVVLSLVSAVIGGLIVFLCMRGKRCSDHKLVICQDPDQNLDVT